jgi:hypothetical protein
MGDAMFSVWSLPRLYSEDQCRIKRWETKLVNCEVTFQAVWPVAKSLSKRGELKAPSAVHDPIGPIFYPFDKANIIADCIEN